MKPTTILLSAFLALLPACDKPEPEPVPEASTGEASTGDGPTSGEGWVCPAVGAPCDLRAPECGEGLVCRPGGLVHPMGVCASACSFGGGMGACPIGTCDATEESGVGICRDADGLPTGLCPGVPSCAGDPCEGLCANGLTCTLGACSFACKTAVDCEAGQACIAGACFSGDGLADPCNF